MTQFIDNAKQYNRLSVKAASRLAKVFFGKRARAEIRCGRRLIQRCESDDLTLSLIGEGDTWSQAFHAASQAHVERKFARIHADLARAGLV